MERLLQLQDGSLASKSGQRIQIDYPTPVGEIITLVVKNPSSPEELEDIITDMVNKEQLKIPPKANAFVSSNFNPDTQYVKPDENGEPKVYSTYGIQFYDKPRIIRLRS